MNNTTLVINELKEWMAKAPDKDKEQAVNLAILALMYITDHSVVRSGIILDLWKGLDSLENIQRITGNVAKRYDEEAIANSHGGK